MLSELIKLRMIEKLLRQKRFSEVLLRANDPTIRDHRRAVVAAQKAREALLSEAAGRRERGDLTQAFSDVRAVLGSAEDASARRLEKDLRKDREGLENARRAAARAAADVRRALCQGDLGLAHSLHAALPADAEISKDLLVEIAAQERRAESLLASARRALESKDPTLGLTHLRESWLASRDQREFSEVARGLLRHVGMGAAPEAEVSALAAFLTTCGPLEAPIDAEMKSAAVRILKLVEKAIEHGEFESAERLCVGLPESLDPKVSSTLSGVTILRRASAAADEGDHALACDLLGEAEAVLPSMAIFARKKKEWGRRTDGTDVFIRKAKDALGRGALLEARSYILDLLEEAPRHRTGLDLLASIETQEGNDQETLRKARELVSLGVEGSLEDSRRLLLLLDARRPDLPEIQVLLRDVERRLKEVRRLSALREASKRPAPALSVATPREIPQKNAFILRVEEHGDWLVHPRDSLVLGHRQGGQADIPFMAAVSARHVVIERRDLPTGECVYRLIPEKDRRVLKNRKLVLGEVGLTHGDVLSLADAVHLTFLRPIAKNRTAALRIDGDFDVHGCRHVILFSESGREGSIVLGPAPEAHVPMTRDADRIELFRALEGAHAGQLVARGPRGVSISGGGERPQVAVRALEAIRAGSVTLFLDPASV